jgi:hypothetical protein
MNLPITLYPARSKLLLYFTGSVLVIAASLWTGYTDHTGSYALRAIVVTCGVIYVVLPRVTGLHINADGFSIRTLFRTYNVIWKDVAEFSTAPYGRGRVVLFRYTQLFEENALTSSPLALFTIRRFKLSRMNEEWKKSDAALPDDYGMGAEDLARLMNELRTKFSVKQI